MSNIYSEQNNPSQVTAKSMKTVLIKMFKKPDEAFLILSVLTDVGSKIRREKIVVSSLQPTFPLSLGSDMHLPNNTHMQDHHQLQVFYNCKHPADHTFK